MILGDAVAQVTHVYAQPQYIQLFDKQGLDEIFFDLLVPSLSETHRKSLPGKIAQQTPKPRVPEHTGRRGGNKAQFVMQPLPVSLFVASTTALQFVCFFSSLTTDIQTQVIIIRLDQPSACLPPSSSETRGHLLKHCNPFTAPREPAQYKSDRITAH